MFQASKHENTLNDAGFAVCPKGNHFVVAEQRVELAMATEAILLDFDLDNKAILHHGGVWTRVFFFRQPWHYEHGRIIRGGRFDWLSFL